MKKIYLSILGIILFSQFSYSQWTTSGTNIYNTNTGSVGIGITNPSYNLHISGNDFPFALVNSTLNSTTSTGETSFYIGDASSGIKMLRASKRTNNTRAFEIWTEYGYNIPSKSGEFYRNYINFYTADVNRLTITSQGYVGIGTTTPQESLSVNGNIRSKQVKVETTNWPDYVFEDHYKVMPLSDLEKYITKNKHLPEMPSAIEIESTGQNLGEINLKLLKNLEELTIHLIEKDKQIQQQDLRIKRLENNMADFSKKKK